MTDANRFQENDQALCEGEAMLRAALENMPEPFIIFKSMRDSDGRIVDFSLSYANLACRAAIDRYFEKPHGKSLLDLIPPARLNGMFERFCCLVDTGEPLVVDNFEFLAVSHPGNPPVLLDIRAARVGDGLVVNWRSQTEYRQMQADMAEMQRSLIENAEEERRQLARLLHDGPVQDLYAIDFQLHAIQWQAGDLQTQASLGEIQGQLHQVINILLNTVGQLRPFSLKPFGLKAAILSHLERFKCSHPEIIIETGLDDDQDMLSQETRMGLFRTYQQAIDNIERHARATRIAVTLKVNGAELVLRVEDNGSGFMLPERLVTLARSGHMGIAAAYDQMARLGGELHIQSGLGEGTVVTASLPI